MIRIHSDFIQNLLRPEASAASLIPSSMEIPTMGRPRDLFKNPGGRGLACAAQHLWEHSKGATVHPRDHPMWFFLVQICFFLVSIVSGWWFGTFFLFFHILGIVTQLTFIFFQRDWNHQPGVVFPNALSVALQVGNSAYLHNILLVENL